MNEIPSARDAATGRTTEVTGDAFRAELPADLESAGRARATVRQALGAWHMEHLADDAELLTSELVANAAEHGGGQPISLACTGTPIRTGGPISPAK